MIESTVTSTVAPTASAVPVGTHISSDVEKAVSDALGELIDKVNTHEDVLKKSRPHEQPKSWFADPFALLDSLGMGYRAQPGSLTYDTLRAISEKDTIVAAIVATRVNQVAAFARPQQNKYSVGFKIQPRGGDKKRRLTHSEKERAEDIEHFLLNTGVDYNIGRDSFETFLRKVVRDRLTYDQVCVEKVKTYGGSMHAMYVVPGDTIRIAHPKIAKGTPPDVADLKRQLKYVQLLNAQIVTEFTQDELAFMVANPRTNVKVYGYGFPEIEILMTTVTSHMWAEEWNRRAFSQGSTTKGVLNLKGSMPLQQFEAFKRQWQAQVSGVTNAWKTPVVNTEGLDWIQMQMSNTEMGYQMWMEYLIKIASAIFQIDPAEVNFDLRGSSGQQPVFMSNNEAQQKVSKDRGLSPLLRYLEDMLNKHIVWQIDPRFELNFVGLDAKTEEQAIQLRMQQVQNIYTLNEVRAMEDLPPVKEGDIVLNPTYTGFMQQKAMAAQQGGGPGGPPGAGPPGPPGAGAPPMGGGQQPPGKPQAGGAPGQDEQQAGPQQPYQGRFASKQHGDEEQKGADNLRQFGEAGSEGQEDQPAPGAEDDEDKPSDIDSSTRRVVHINDWDSTVHSSLKPGDLQKSQTVYDTIDLD